MSKFNLFSRSALSSMAALAGGAAVTGGAPNPEEDPEAGPAPNEDEDEGSDEEAANKQDKPKKPGCEGAAEAAQPLPVVALSDAQSHAAEQFAAGRKAERERTAAVLGSDVGKANAAMASWMLSASPDASADAIIAQLSTMPAQPSTASSAPAGSAPAGSAAAGSAAAIPDTNVDIGRGSARDALGASDKSGDDVWAEVQGNAVPVIPADASRLTQAALQAGGRTVQVSSAAPATPAVPPTGN